MQTVNLIAAALKRELGEDYLAREFESDLVIGICAVTGKYDVCVPRKDLLGKSFTNGDLLAAPQSKLISLDAYTALTYKWERASSWYCDGYNFIRLNRKGVRNMILNPVRVLTPDRANAWSGYVTTSYKKHGSLFTKVNRHGGKVIWRFETRDVDCTDHVKLMKIWDRLNLELRSGIGRTIMESLDCPPFLIKKIGIQRWVAFEQWARPLYQGALYQFLCYLLPSQEELRFEGNPFFAR